jgi:hypothetical protein
MHLLFIANYCRSSFIKTKQGIKTALTLRIKLNYEII